MDAPRHKQSKQRHAAAEGASMPSAALPSLSATSQAHPSAPPLQGSFQARPPSAPPLQGSLGLQAPAVTQPGVSLAHQQPEGQEEEGEEEEEEGSLLSVQQGGDELGTQQEGLQPVAPIGALPTTAGGPSSGLPNRVQQQQEQQGEEAGLSPAARPAAAGPFFPSGRHSSSRGPPANAEEGKEAAGCRHPLPARGRRLRGCRHPLPALQQPAPSSPRADTTAGARLRLQSVWDARALAWAECRIRCNSCRAPWGNWCEGKEEQLRAVDRVPF